MSEYQYYEFQAIDHRLDDRAMGALRALTSRAEITPTSLVNVYHFGSFRGNPDRLMDQYFNAHLYLANWGTRRLMLRLPRAAFDLAVARPYAVPDVLTVRATPEHVILDFHSNEEDGGDHEGGEGWLDALIPLREDLLAGDLRCLYLSWLQAVETEEVDEEVIEPPVPPGLGQLSGALKKLAQFLRVDHDLIDAAAAGSSAEASTRAAAEEMAAWVRALPPAEKDQLLLRVMRKEAVQLGGELLLRMRQDRARAAKHTAKGGTAEPTRRTVASLRGTWEQQAEENRRREAERAAHKREEQAREQAAARVRHLDALVGREKELWRQVESAIATMKPKEYERAVALLQDLLDLGERAGESTAVAKRINALRQKHSGKSSLMKRLKHAGLIT